MCAGYGQMLTAGRIASTKLAHLCGAGCSWKGFDELGFNKGLHMQVTDMVGKLQSGTIRVLLVFMHAVF